MIFTFIIAKIRNTLFHITNSFKNIYKKKYIQVDKKHKPIYIYIIMYKYIIKWNVMTNFIFSYNRLLKNIIKIMLNHKYVLFVSNNYAEWNVWRL